jgi:hypothetical protein
MMRSMKGWTCLLFLVACTAGDDTANGARDNCAEGGTLNQCPATVRTPDGACWRLVECGALPLASDSTGDWASCVDRISGMRDVAQQLVIACIASATCDQLKYDRGYCIDLGDP